jgi:hypothetical protein
MKKYVIKRVSDLTSNLETEGISDRVTQQVTERIRRIVISFKNYMIVFCLLGNYCKIHLEN